MRLTIENIIVVLTLVFCEAWFLNEYGSGKPGFEPAIGFLISLGAVFTKDKIKEYFGLSGESGSHDQRLFDEFQSIFPAEPTLRLLKESNFGASFHKDEIQPLHNFCNTWDSVEKEFLNKGIEKNKKALYKAAKELACEFSKRTVPVGNGDRCSVFPDDQRGEPRSQHVIEDARILDEKSRLFVPKYEAFVRKCRARLKS